MIPEGRGKVAASGNAGGTPNDGGAGIGGGEHGDSSAEGNFITITGGTVTPSVPDGTEGAAIGNGGGTNATDVPITFGEGMTVTAGAKADGTGAAAVTDAANNKGYKYARVCFLLTQAIEASDVSATYGETGKAVSARVSDPSEGGGAISYAVKEGSEEYVDKTGLVSLFDSTLDSTFC